MNSWVDQDWPWTRPPCSLAFSLWFHTHSSMEPSSASNRIHNQAGCQWETVEVLWRFRRSPPICQDLEKGNLIFTTLEFQAVLKLARNPEFMEFIHGFVENFIFIPIPSLRDFLLCDLYDAHQFLAHISDKKKYYGWKSWLDGYDRQHWQLAFIFENGTEITRG